MPSTDKNALASAAAALPAPPVKTVKSQATATESSAVWDEKVQQYHGGQDWQFLGNFREDFSVTTNGLGTPRGALEAAKKAVDSIDHYPPANQEPALSSLAQFLWPAAPAGGDGNAGDSDCMKQKGRLLLGNGASELIDLVVRCSPVGPWCGGPSVVQYKEYQRSAMSHGRQVATDPSQAQLLSLVNPTNPTGDYMNIRDLCAWIEQNVSDGSAVTVDESMQLWVGPHWRQDSLVSQHAWVRRMWEERRVAVFVIHSWTKIWSCTGIRLGSVVCPSAEHCEALRKVQVPWSVNTPALAFLHEVVSDEAYMNETWECTTTWRKYAVDRVEAFSQERQLNWTVHGAPFLSWLWIDMKDAAVAEKTVDVAKTFGVPVRWAKYGYELPTFVRIAARSEDLTDLLLHAWATVL